MTSPLASPYDYLRKKSDPALRYGRWPAPVGTPRGTILVLQGRSEYMEKYEETIGELLARRLDVFSFDWRGQGLSDRMLPEPELGFVERYEDYLDDLDRVLKAVVLPAARGPIFLLAHSMGGHIGLRYLYQYEHHFEKAILISPMIGVHTGPVLGALARWLSRRQVAAGRGRRVVFGSGRYTPFPKKFRGNRLTSDRRRFFRNRQWLSDHPAHSSAYVTYGWLAASYGSIDVLNRLSTAVRLGIPLLVAGAGADRIVSQKALSRFVSAAGCRFLSIENARHEILQECDRQRSLFWRTFDEFIEKKKNVPPP